MSKQSADQALFGYDRGHRLLASSIELTTDTVRMLGNVTDMAFEGKATSYLTVVPVPMMNAQAFVKTWPAKMSRRAGSVWSHVIIVDATTLARVESVRDLLALFRQPEAFDNEDLSKKSLKPFTQRLTFQDTHGIDLRSGHAHIDEELAAHILAGLYQSASPVRVQSSHPQKAEETLLAIFDQQWPKLRRGFSMRTRYRTSESAAAFAELEVLERAPRADDSAKATPWAQHMAQDLVQPDPNFRAFLRRYGADAVSGRADMYPLARIYSETRSANSSPVEVIGVLRKAYPRPSSMRRLKRDMLGPADDRKFELVGWPANDEDRLRLSLAAGQAIDYTDLKIGERLVDAAENNANFKSVHLEDLSLESIAPAQVEALVDGVSRAVSREAALTIARMNRDVGILIVSQRPTLLDDLRVWEVLDSELLSEIFEHASGPVQDAVLRKLITAGGAGPVAQLIKQRPDRWWDLLNAAASHGEDWSALARDAQVLRESLGMLGAAALGVPERPPRTDGELMALLLSADLSAGLWRRAPSRVWLSLARRLSKDPRLPGFAVERLLAVLLLTAMSSGSPTVRTDAWKFAFPELHQSLMHREFDSEAWGLLAHWLPAGSEWDRCSRLRRGAVDEILRDNWPDSEVERLADSVGALGREVVAATRRDDLTPKRSFIRDFFGWMS